VAAREAAVARYVAERGRRLTEPVVVALRSRGLTTAALYVEGSDPAGAIVDTANRIDAGLIVIGTTRPIFADGSWGSVSAEVMRNSRRPLLLVPGASRDTEDLTERPFVADPA
jgi:nucleotide-binding universal stress UspA family protein